MLIDSPPSNEIVPRGGIVVGSVPDRVKSPVQERLILRLGSEGVLDAECARLFRRFGGKAGQLIQRHEAQPGAVGHAAALPGVGDSGRAGLEIRRGTGGPRADPDTTRLVAPVDEGWHGDNRRDNRSDRGHAGREPTMPPAPGPGGERGEVGLADGVGHHLRPERADHPRIRHDLPQCAPARRRRSSRCHASRRQSWPTRPGPGIAGISPCPPRR